MCTHECSHSSSRPNQFSPEHCPCFLPSMHWYCAFLLHPLGGRHVHSGKPLGCSCSAFFTFFTRSSLSFGRLSGLALVSCPWMGADTLKTSCLSSSPSHRQKFGSHSPPGVLQLPSHHSSDVAGDTWKHLPREVSPPRSGRSV